LIRLAQVFPRQAEDLDHGGPASAPQRSFQGGIFMLIITRRTGEKIMLGDEILIHVMEIVGNSVRTDREA
jgi:Global regulator protein family